MLSATSKDGTTIAYEVSGRGPSVILVDGALCYHGSGPGRKIAKLLSQHSTTYLYDRRGRGESGSTEPYAVEREVEDLEAIIKVAGGSAVVFGQSSGAILALEAAQLLGPEAIAKLALYEAPIIANNDRSPLGQGDLEHMRQLIRDDRRTDAILFFFKSVELPGLLSSVLRLTPLWRRLKAIAPTLANDFTITAPYQTGTPLAKERWQNVTMPTWVGAGSKSPPWMQHSGTMLAHLLPNALYCLLPNQTHNVKAKGLVPPLVQFLGEDH
jgi:pimeloyl-ACP methyl ester carboxylesterase